MVARGVYPGRFQPFHWGHVSVVRWALERGD
ncbi:MAG: adenylyltransferase/cytidyltransferase family protein, partial [Ignisphaera sp.]|nr:adenylyltransferase/cytidyltransferase family protein [Ignisphaera sp.]